MSAKARVTPVPEEEMRIRSGFRVGEAAFLLGLSYDVTLALIRKGELGARPVGKSLIVPALEIERFLAPAVRGAA